MHPSLHACYARHTEQCATKTPCWLCSHTEQCATKQRIALWFTWLPPRECGAPRGAQAIKREKQKCSSLFIALIIFRLLFFHQGFFHQGFFHQGFFHQGFFHQKFFKPLFIHRPGENSQSKCRELRIQIQKTFL